MKKLFVFSLTLLAGFDNNAQLACTILQNDTTICRGISLQLSVDTNTLFTVCNAAALPASLQTGLVAYYPFCGNANDESGNGNNGTVIGATLTTDRFGIANRAYSFNGSNYIIGPASNFPVATRTVSLWFYATNIGVSIEGPTLMGYGGGMCGTSWFETIDNPGTPNGEQNTYQVQGHCNNESVLWNYGATHPNNAWHHWVITTSASGTKFYLDGVMVLSDTTFINETYVQGKDFIFGGPVGVNGIGFYTDGNIYGLQGKLDDVFIYNRELSAAEALLLYQSQLISWSTGETTPSITVTPAQSTTYYVTVSDSISTCTDSVSISISFVDTSLAVLDPTTICSINDSVRMQAGIATSYQWLRNGIPIPGATASNYTATQTGTYRVVVTNNIGCTDTSRSVDINLNPQPVVGFTINDQTQCLQGNNFIFTNTSTISSGTMTYLWNFGDGNSATGTNASHSYITAGSFNILLTATSDNGCMDSLVRNITVHPDPLASFTVNNSGQCLNGNNFIFTNTSTISSGTMTYLWNFGDGNTSTAINTNHTYSAPGNFTVTLITTSDNGCSDTSVFAVSVYPKPVVSFNVNNSSQCITGNNFIFTNTSSISSGSMTFLWDFGDGNTTTTQNATHSYAAIGTYTVKLVALSNNGCSDSVIQNVTVAIGPVANFTINSASQCLQGNNFIFTNSTVPAGSMSYLWSFGDGGTTFTTNAVHIYTSAGTFNVKLVATSNNGCKDSITRQVTVFPQPQTPVIISSGPLSICEGSSVTLSTNGAPALQWYNNNSPIAGQTNSSLTVNQSGSYTVTSTNASGCSSTSSAAVVTVNPLPTGTLLNPPQNFICAGSSVTLTASGAFSYQWYLNGSPIAGATAATYNATQAGIYTVEFISAAGCRRVSSNSVTLSLVDFPGADFLYNLYCENIPVVFNNMTDISVSGPVTFNWAFGDGSNSTATNPVHIYSTANTYTVKLVATSVQCPQVKDSISRTIIIEKPVPGIQYTAINVLINTTVQLNARPIGVYYLWVPPVFLSDATIPNPDATPAQDQLYRILITSPSGCVTVDTQLVKVFKKVEIYVPEGFSPNGDGHNDVLMPVLAGIKELKYFRVYNRWGQLMFQTNKPGEGWEGNYKGSKQPMETYNWVAEGIDIYDKPIKRAGATILIR
jgi:gliding motility-associated-like protein